VKQGPGWSPMEKMLYVSVVPLVAVVGMITLLTFFQSEKDSAPSAQASPVARRSTAEDALHAQRDAVRKTYQDCLKGMGVNFGGSRFRSRFSARPDMNKMRDAMAFCRNLIEQGTPAAKPRRPATLPVA